MWSRNGGAALSHPAILQAVHEDYLRAGAEVVIANTFATNEQVLTDAGELDRYEDYNRRAVELAIAARECVPTAQGAVVAGGIAYWSFLDVVYPEPTALAESAARQATILADAGADVIVLEMMGHTDRMLGVLEGAQRSGLLPVWVGLSCGLDAAGEPILMFGDKLRDAVDALDRVGGVDVLNIMHTEVAQVDACLEVVKRRWDGVIGVYAHSSQWDAPADGPGQGHWVFEDVISPRDYATASSRWLDAGVQLIGGCCGTSPAHIEPLHAFTLLEDVWGCPRH